MTKFVNLGHRTFVNPAQVEYIAACDKTWFCPDDATKHGKIYTKVMVYLLGIEDGIESQYDLETTITMLEGGTNDIPCVQLESDKASTSTGKPGSDDNV